MTLYDSYIQEVLSGKIIAGKAIIDAVKRHVEDLKQSKKRNYPFYFDEKIADTAIKIIQIMPLTSSREYQGFPLQEWQAFIVAMLHGWRNKKTKFRRFKRLTSKSHEKTVKRNFLLHLRTLNF